MLSSVNKTMRKYRINKADMFKLIYSEGRRLNSDGLRIFYISAPDNIMRYVGVVRKKVYKSAVSRNRVKRVLRESFFEYLPKLNGNYWILIDLKTKTDLKKSLLSQKTYQLISNSGLN